MALGSRGVSMVSSRIPLRARAYRLQGGTRRPRRVSGVARPPLSGNASAPGRHAPPQGGTFIGVSWDAPLGGRTSPPRTRL